MSLYLETDPLSGAVSTLDYDHDADVAIVKRVEDVQPILDWNKEQANHGVRRRTPGELDMVLAARIPMTIAYKWFNEHGIRAWKREDEQAVKRMLNSNEYRYLRCNGMVL